MNEYLKTRQSGSKTRTIANLKQADRCDRCPASAAAVVMVKTKGPDLFFGIPSPQDVKLPLLFCNHHLNQHEPALAGKGFEIYRKED